MVTGADMLEHPDRNDPVEGPFQLPVVDQLEPDMVGDPGFLGAPPGDRQLLL